jgi:hypothetical protein
MSLLAYSLRRAWGSLLVFLVVVWLLMLGVAHVGPIPFHPLETSGPLSELPWNRLQPGLAQSWNLAAVEVGVGVLVLAGLVGLWKLRPKTRSLWVLFATGSVLLAFGLASFGVALANQDYRRIHWFDAQCERWCVPTAIQEHWERTLNRGIDPTPWWIAGGISTGLGVILVAGSVRAKNAVAVREPSH